MNEHQHNEQAWIAFFTALLQTYDTGTPGAFYIPPNRGTIESIANAADVALRELQTRRHRLASLPTPGVPVERVRALAEKWRSQTITSAHCADELDALAQERGDFGHRFTHDNEGGREHG